MIHSPKVTRWQQVVILAVLSVYMIWVPQKVIITLGHPPPRSPQSGRRSADTCPSQALFARWKIPLFLFCSPPLRRSLNLAWWVCLGRQCCAEPGKSMFLYLQLRRKCRPFLLPTTVPSAWLINSHVSTDVVRTSLRQQVNVCVLLPVASMRMWFSL